MSQVGILSPSLSIGDAVTNDALGMSEALKSRGYEVRLFCETHALDNGRVYDAARITRFLTGSDDILIYHYSMGWAPGLDLLQQLKCRKVVKYHNVTPAKFFHGFSSNDEHLCRTGREQLVDLVRSNCDLFLSASAFNMNELISLGADISKSFVVPPFHHIDRLNKVSPDGAVLKTYSDGRTNILSVGRVAPHKGHLTLLEAFAHFYYNCNRASRLIIVGKGGEGLSPYSKLLNRAVDALGIREAVVFTGGVSEAALTAYYTVADVFVTASEHEGFCVPLVEAMSMKTPITAFASAAIPETLGDAGVVWPERDPLLMAETLALLAADSKLRTSLGARGLRRYQTHFTNEEIETRFLSAISSLQ